MRRLAVILILLALTGCTEEEKAWWVWWDAQPVGCHEAIDRIWPEQSRRWAHRIVTRESGGDPGAQNRRSTAAGCFQLLRMHAWRYDATGSSWAARYDAKANTRAALHLYMEQGARPW